MIGNNESFRNLNWKDKSLVIRWHRFTYSNFPPAALASAVSLLMFVGHYHVYTELRDNTSSRGSVLVFDWFFWEFYAYPK